jgi:hypothetical protein
VGVGERQMKNRNMRGRGKEKKEIIAVSSVPRG